MDDNKKEVGIEKLSDTVYKLEEGTFLVKDKFGWVIQHPAKKDLNKPLTKDNINWFNLLIGGSWIRFIFIIFMILMIIFATMEYNSNLEKCNAIINEKNQVSLFFNNIQPPNMIQNGSKDKYSLSLPS